MACVLNTTFPKKHWVFPESLWKVNHPLDATLNQIISTAVQSWRSKLRRGFLKLLQHCLRLREGSLVHCGPPCSTWVWVNRHSSKRSKDCPEGDSDVPSVASSNESLDSNSINLNLRGKKFPNKHKEKTIYEIYYKYIQLERVGVLQTLLPSYPRITCRVALLVLLALSRCCHILIEQPRTSLMPHYERFTVMAERLAEHFGLAWKSTNMSSS